ncbi:MAG TPA: FAD-dependent oxidoreductase [Burkholderiales bacterium]|nr:FAD-dependent oxidoreductase [Burkholderiales bacterium]
MANQLLVKRREQMFPKLSARQVERLKVHGRLVNARAGDVLVEPGDRPRKIVVVLSGSLDILFPGLLAEQLITTLVAGDFSGEMSALRGVSGFTRIRAREDATVLAIKEDALRDLVQTDAELSELFMRAFILRRMGLVEAGQSEIVLLGSRYCAGTLRLREFLTRSVVPYVYIDVDSDAGVEALLERFHVSTGEIPVVIGRGGTVLKNPSLHEVAEMLDMNPAMDVSTIHDLVVVGAGPAGLAAAVYGASEGLDVVVVESGAPGGQAGTSSRIENYLGFPTGISGQALAGRALTQAQKFGANVTIATQAKRLHCEKRPYRLELSDGRSLLASTIVVATGAKYRDIEIENLQKFVGVGVYYAATNMEARLCEGEEIAIVGGGNSAGQAAVFLANTCRHVHIMVRADSLSESMSRYLIRRIEENPDITLHVRTQIAVLEGSDKLERVGWRTQGNPEVEMCDIGSVFLMTGAVPNTAWLQGCVKMDDKGFVCTGADLHPEHLDAAGWPLARQPYLMETTLPGVFAVGDVRSGSVKRIASGVGEGSICVQFVHRALAELSVASRDRIALQPGGLPLTPLPEPVASR